MRIDLVTIFPDFIRAALDFSLMKRAREEGRLIVGIHDLRDFAADKRRTVDDAPYGGGAGMVLKPEPIFGAVESVRTDAARVILMTPQGVPFSQAMARGLASAGHLIFVCGHYEGYDERVREHLVTDEISIGDYVLTGGELPALVVIDAVARLLPGVVGNAESLGSETFEEGLLEYPQYTRPADFRGWTVPDVLSSGHHAEVAKWRRAHQEQRTRERRPDLWRDYLKRQEQKSSGVRAAKADERVFPRPARDREPFEGEDS